jgi:hypothetical protein
LQSAGGCAQQIAGASSIHKAIVFFIGLLYVAAGEP